MQLKIPHRITLDKIGLRYIGQGWNGLDWAELDWIGLDYLCDRRFPGLADVVWLYGAPREYDEERV
jgi:hypothetical protein